MAQTAQLPEALLQRVLPAYALEHSLFDANPGTMSYRDTMSLSEAVAVVEFADMDHAIIPQNGAGRKSASLRAKSYQHLDQRGTAWGEAAFSIGGIQDVRFCNSLDYDLIAPYVLGDETGGDLDFREYRFGGGYSYRFNEKWSVGALLDYRAEIAWRDVDPRIKTVVSNLTASLGASYAVDSKRLLGGAASVYSYTQNCDLDFYNPLNDITTLPYTGLGTFYKRFAGNTNKNSGHSGLGYSFGLQWIPIDGNGFMASVGMRYMHISLLLRNFNNITLAYTGSRSYQACAGYGRRLSPTVKITPMVRGEYFRRIGTENLFGVAAGASYDKIGSQSPYLNERLRGELMLPVEIAVGSGYLTAVPSARFCSYKESLTTVATRIDSQKLRPGMLAQYSVVSRGRWLYSVAADYSYDKVLYVDVNSLGIEISASRLFGGIMAGISAGYRRMTYAGNRHCDCVHASIEMKF